MRADVLLGMLAIAQALYIPGYLALKLAQVKTGSLLETAILSGALSLIANYLFVFALTSVGAYGRVSALALIAAEIAIVLLLLARARFALLRDGVRVALPSPEPVRWLSGSAVAVSTAVFGIAALAALQVVARLDVFEAWDPILTWNQWAYAWMQGAIPAGTGLYPQLVPAVWSLMYLIAGSPELQCVPLAVVPLLGLGILAMFLDLGLRRERSEYLVALVLCGLVFWHWRGELFAPNLSILGGYPEIPLTFMATAALYVLELKDDRLLVGWRQLALPLILAAGATLTKPNGAYALGVVLMLAIVGHISARPRLSPGVWLKSGALTVAVLAVLPGTWWGLKIFDFASGRDATGAAALVQAASSAGGDGGILQHLAQAARVFPGSPILAIVLALGIVLSLTVRRSRWVVVGILAPYTLLWAWLLSHDIRNWLPMLPVAAYAAAFGFCGVVERRWGVDMRIETSPRDRVVSPRTIQVGTLLFVVMLAGASVFVPQDRLVTAQVMAQYAIGNAHLNEIVYTTLVGDQTAQGDLLTDYRYLRFVPGFRNEPYRLKSSPRFRVTYVPSDEITPQDLHSARVLLISDLAPRAVSAAIDRGIEEGEYRVLAEYLSEPKRGGYQARKWRVRLIKTGGQDA